MKALLDEQLSPLIAASLRQSGFDDEGRAVVTNNIKDFRPLGAEFVAQSRSHAGLILLPSSRTRSLNAVSALARAIEDVLRAHPGGIAGSERWIGPLPRE